VAKKDDSSSVMK